MTKISIWIRFNFNLVLITKCLNLYHTTMNLLILIRLHTKKCWQILLLYDSIFSCLSCGRTKEIGATICEFHFYTRYLNSSIFPNPWYMPKIMFLWHYLLPISKGMLVQVILTNGSLLTLKTFLNPIKDNNFFRF